MLNPVEEEEEEAGTMTNSKNQLQVRSIFLLNPKPICYIALCLVAVRGKISVCQSRCSSSL